MRNVHTNQRNKVTRVHTPQIPLKHVKEHLNTSRFITFYGPRRCRRVRMNYGTISHFRAM